MTKDTDLSRRQFMGVAAGGILGVTALASLGLDAAPTANTPKIDLESFITNQSQADVLVIGGGMAGLFAAVKAHDAGARVVMVSKGRLGRPGRHGWARGPSVLPARGPRHRLRAAARGAGYGPAPPDPVPQTARRRPQSGSCRRGRHDRSCRDARNWHRAASRGPRRFDRFGAGAAR